MSYPASFRFFFLLLAIHTVSAVVLQSAESRPNVILIMADDLGYETIGANGGTSYRTPVLDGLAAGGVRFEHCYVQPLCTPTRVQMMTGAYNVRNYITFGEMDPKLTTFGNLFRDAGYDTAIAGKWQLGQDPGLPAKFGFSEHCLWQHTRRPPRYANPGLEVNGVEKDFPDGEYGPTLVNDFVLDYISRHREAPFFLYYPMILTHDPYQPTPDSPDWDPKAVGEKVNRKPEHFGQMVEYMDKMIGRVVARLEETGLREKTLLVFLGDNGTGKGTVSMMGDRKVIGGKGTTTDAGMHVPLIVSWPGKIGKGTVVADLVDSTDFLPTICDAAGIDLAGKPTVDGRSFLPQLRGEKGTPRPWVYSWYSPRGEPLREFAFDQHYKLYRGGEFYDLAADPAEQTPLNRNALTGPAVEAAAKLQTALDQYSAARPDSLPKRELATGNSKGKGKGKKKAGKEE
ncbi:MAG: sulfatase-like hydrolase/transferase [Verrucomicrobiae bacterium]|nr:sulfatase-like hydrolase/transferase [Verrucomicrobiae bacterium]